MANDYYNQGVNFVPGTKVRSDDIDTELAAIEDGFDKLAGADELSNGSHTHGDDTGTTDTVVVDNGGTTTFVEGQQVTFIPAETNTGPVTMALNGGTAKAVVRNDGEALQARDLLIDLPVMVIYDGTSWVLVGATAEQTKQYNRPAMKTVSVVTYTFLSADEGSLIQFTNAADIAVTVPNETTDPMPIGWMCHIAAVGAGVATLSGEAGVVLNYAQNLATRTLNSSLSIIKTAANEFLVVGDQQ